MTEKSHESRVRITGIRTGYPVNTSRGHHFSDSLVTFYHIPIEFLLFSQLQQFPLHISPPAYQHLVKNKLDLSMKPVSDMQTGYRFP